MIIGIVPLARLRTAALSVMDLSTCEPYFSAPSSRGLWPSNAGRYSDPEGVPARQHESVYQPCKVCIVQLPKSTEVHRMVPKHPAI